MLCWWDMNEGTSAYPVRTLAEMCVNADPLITNAIGFCQPTFCTFECAYAFMLCHEYTDAQIACLTAASRCRINAPKCLFPAVEPFILQHPYGGPLADIDLYRTHQLPGVNVPYAQRSIYKADVQDVLLEQQRERKEILGKVSKAA